MTLVSSQDLDQVVSVCNNVDNDPADSLIKGVTCLSQSLCGSEHRNSILRIVWNLSHKVHSKQNSHWGH
jgi:hypothetical protein